MNFGFELNKAGNGLSVAEAMNRDALGEEAFHRMISMERRRTVRSRKSFLLMLLDMGDHSTAKNNRLSLGKVMSTLSLMLRETDVTGWYKENSVVGVMFTEIASEDRDSIPAPMMTRVSQTLKNHLPPQQFHQIGISFHLLPESQEHEAPTESAFSAVYPGVAAADGSTETSL